MTPKALAEGLLSSMLGLALFLVALALGRLVWIGFQSTPFWLWLLLWTCLSWPALSVAAYRRLKAQERHLCPVCRNGHRRPSVPFPGRVEKLLWSAIASLDSTQERPQGRRGGYSS